MMFQLAVSTLFCAGCAFATSRDAGQAKPPPTHELHMPSELDSGSARPPTVAWEHVAAWPSDAFMVRHHINYLGPNAKMIVNHAKGTVVAWLADPGTAEDIRCKHEIAGLGEIHDLDKTFFLSVARAALRSCDETARATRDAELLHDWNALSSTLAE